MEKKNRWKNSSIWMISVGAALVMAAFLFWEPTPKAQYDVVILGDSITGNRDMGKGVDGYLEELTGKTVLLGSFGGTAASYNAGEEMPALRSQLCLAKLAEAFANRDFAAQKAMIAYGDAYGNETNQVPFYFAERIRQLEQTDLSKAEYVVIAFGTNDYDGGYALDDTENAYNSETFGGALRSALEQLTEAYPQVQIVLMTPPWCCFFWGEETVFCEDADFGYGNLEQFVQLELAIAQEYGLPVIDSYHNSGIGRDNYEDYLTDGMHLTVAGQELLAELMADKLAESDRVRQ